MRIILSLLIGYLHFQNAHANGGPVNPASVVRVGDVELLNMPSVEVLREDLHIRVEGEYSAVTVRYLLRNHDYDTDTMTYGFPVDFVSDQLREKFAWRADYVPVFEFFMDKKPLPVREQMDFSVMFDKFGSLENNFAGERENSGVEGFRRKWYFTEFVLEREATAELEVRYRVKNHSNDFANTKDFFPSFSRRLFRYDFTPAAYWGEGKAGEFNVVVDDREMARCKGNFEISGLDFQRNSEGLLVFSQKNFDLAKAEDLRFSLDIDEKFRSDFMMAQRIPNNLVKSVRASSTLDGGSYEAKNLLDGDFSTAWSEGGKGGGIGSWVEIELSPKYELETIAIANGYAKNKEVYDNNNRLKCLQIEFEYLTDEAGKTEIFRDTLVFVDTPWQPIKDYNLAEICPVSKDGFDWYMEPVSRVRLTILDVWPGKKHNDTCISEVLLSGWKIRDESDE